MTNSSITPIGTSMKKPVFYLCLLAISFVFMGCPYESEHPLDVPSIAVSKDYMGKWFSGDLVVKKKDAYTYLVMDIGTTSDKERKAQEKEAKKMAKENGEKYEPSKKEDPTVYSAHLTVLNNVTFVNVQKAESRTWYIYKMEGNNEKVTISGLTPYIKESFSGSKQLSKFVAENMQYSFFFGDDQTFTRVE
jgi:hypothetical protein